MGKRKNNRNFFFSTEKQIENKCDRTCVCRGRRRFAALSYIELVYFYGPLVGNPDFSGNFAAETAKKSKRKD